jgi:hypothetical protein
MMLDRNFMDDAREALFQAGIKSCDGRDAGR